MELLELDQVAMVVRSLGDTPGVVAHMTPQCADGSLRDGPGNVAIDPGGSHPFALLDGTEVIDVAANPMTHVALAVLAGSSFAHTSHALIEIQGYSALAKVAWQHQRFSDLNSQRMAGKYGAASCAAAAIQFEAVFADYKAHVLKADPEDCGCMACAVRRFNAPTIENQVTLTGEPGQPTPDDIVRTAEELEALDRMVDEGVITGDVADAIAPHQVTRRRRRFGRGFGR